jgi:copper resistance protein B
MRRAQGISAALVVTGLGACFSLPAHAQTEGADPDSTAPFGPPIEDQRVYVHGLVEQFEGRIGNGDTVLRWDGEFWAGTDSDRLWLKSQGEAGSDKVGDGQHEILYDKPISTYFDLQAGLRSDIDSAPGRNWAALGVEGLAPYFFHVSATAYASDSGHYAAKFMGIFELLVTQRWILQPQIEANLYTANEAARGIGAGLSDIDMGLRLRYEITRKFAPYIGVSYEQKFAGTEDFARAGGERGSNVRLAFGVRAWF